MDFWKEVSGKLQMQFAIREGGEFRGYSPFEVVYLNIPLQLSAWLIHSTNTRERKGQSLLSTWKTNYFFFMKTYISTVQS